jgi:hypothetical protein
MIFQVQSWCSFGAESVILHGHFPYDLSGAILVQFRCRICDTAWTKIPLLSGLYGRCDTP